MGGLAIISWGGLGALGALSASMPAYFVLMCCFAIAALLGLFVCRVRGLVSASLINPGILLHSLLLSAYHLVYLEAFHHAEAIPVSLINYLWPACLIILGNLFFTLKSGMAGYLGAILGFMGVAILVLKDGFTVHYDQALGYGLALLGAVLWALFSNLRRHDPSEVIEATTTIRMLSAIFCGVFWLFQAAPIPAYEPVNLLVILLLGIGPAGGAFYLWSIGMQKGNAALLGVLGYSAPVVSTLLMASLDLGSISWNIFAALAFITAGGLVIHFGTERMNPTRN